MAKDKVELDALSAMGFSVGCQVMAMKEALTTQLGLTPAQLEAFNATYDQTYASEMETLIEEIEDEGPAIAELLREMVSSTGVETDSSAGKPEPSEDNPEQPTPAADATLLEKIEAACAQVAAEKPCLLSRKLHERTITARIAFYLQPLVGDGNYVDCEYNKLADGVSADTQEKLSQFDADSVAPSLIIHTRKKGIAGNLAVIGAKWNGDDSAIEQEKNKLSLYLSEPKLAYQSGFLLLLEKDSIEVLPLSED
jgi:hypothetical protein